MTSGKWRAHPAREIAGGSEAMATETLGAGRRTFHEFTGGTPVPHHYSLILSSDLNFQPVFVRAKA